MTNIFRTISLEIGRALLKLAVDRALRKELPAIFTKLDLELPFALMNKARPLDVEALVTDAIGEKLRRVPTPTQINAVLSMYDPVKAAIRNLR
tara:strand:- start:510 stop:788 length:279 start_codon:yes stop_codon:yes gene_type:complete